MFSRHICSILCCFIFILFTIVTDFNSVQAQNENSEQPYIYGIVTDNTGSPMPGVNVYFNASNISGTVSDERGNYKIYVPARQMLTIKFSSMGFITEEASMWLDNGQVREVNIILYPNEIITDTYNVTARKNKAASITKIDAKNVEEIASVAGTVEAVLRTIGGVASNNELSSQYSVRGGNFDENLVYVNDFEIYRPFLVRSGQQEGLSFINPSLVSSIGFSAGGFESRYGDKMSSVLDVTYKKPSDFGGSVSVSTLGINAHVEGTSKKDSISGLPKFTYIAGIRHRNNSYILNSLPTEGNYAPSFTDFQGFFTYNINRKLDVELITNYANNVYRFVPQESETSFGTFNQALRLRIFFDGQERNLYESVMGGLALKYKLNKKSQLKLMTSAFNTQETEAFDIIGQYWVGEVEESLGKEDFGEITRILGVGTFQDWARNRLTSTIINSELRGYHELNTRHFLTWGVKWQSENIDDQLSEWYRLDSAGYSIPVSDEAVLFDDLLKTRIGVQSNRLMGFVQDEFTLGKENRWSMVAGTRFNYWDLNDEFLVSPRIQMAWNPIVKSYTDTDSLNTVKKDLVFRFAAGLYQQPPFYREMRNYEGTINTDLLAQKSVHVVIGSEYSFSINRRPFKLTAELYHKQMWDLVPYNVENVLIRYFGTNSAVGYATGIDLRLNGEFVPGTDSWASISVMQTKENLDNDTYFKFFNAAGEEITLGETDDTVVADSTLVDVGYVSRPTDQRVNFGLFFQDYLPNNENFKMNLTLLFGSGMPFSPNELPQLRNSFKIPFYRRVDIGFSAMLFNRDNREIPEKSVMRNFKSVWASLEIFNLLGVSNTISYNWIRANELIYGVPNYLTARRINAKVIVKF